MSQPVIGDGSFGWSPLIIDQSPVVEMAHGTDYSPFDMMRALAEEARGREHIYDRVREAV